MLPRSGHFTVEADPLSLSSEVVIPPLPLIAGSLDGNLWRAGVFHGNDCFGGGIAHSNEDNERNGSPDDLDGCAMVKICCLVTCRFAVFKYGVELGAKHANKNHHANPHDKHM